VNTKTPPSTDKLAQCKWPVLGERHTQALKEAVAFVFSETSPKAIVATGTIVRGRSAPSSDLDVYVVNEGDFRRRVQRFFNGVPTEIFINPPQMIRDYFREEYADGEPITAHMLATGTVVYAEGTIIDTLRAEARDWLDKRSELTEAQLVAARYAAVTLFEDAMDVANADEGTATMMMSMAVMAMLELVCRMKAGRIPRRKDLLGMVEAIDDKLGTAARDFFTATDFAERQGSAERIADRTIGARGFFEWDSGEWPVPGGPAKG
jgi:predicted nucleotidyltransferase